MGIPLIALDHLINLAGDHARTVLMGLGQDMVPTWVLFNDEGVKIMATPWENDQEKARYRQGMRGLMRAKNVVAYSFITEAWAATLTPEEWKNPLGHLPASQRADRREVVIACAATATEAKYAQWSIERDANGVVTGLKSEPMPEGHEPEGWLGEMLK